MKTADFDYHLPPERIAQTPIEPRDHARMMALHRATGVIEHRRVYDLPEYLRAGDVLVLNDTRVIHARLPGRKETGGRAEIFLLKRLANGAWQVLVRGRNLNEGKRVLVGEENAAHAWATIEQVKEGPVRVVRFEPPIEDLLDDLGEVPLPPYIHEPLPDPERYQTVFGRRAGSVAAPTAGLHFTPELLLALREKGVQFAYVTLHVGLDTFKPVTEEDPHEHKMHREWVSISPESARLVNEARLRGHRIVAVGTTCVRALETAAKIALGLAPCDPAPEGAACGWQTIAAWTGETDLFILPGHTFRAVDAMLTNFHLPRSTLLMLVAAFAGKELIDRAYAEAIATGYRFYSFGDAMLIL
ncbi:MAG: tRNA preQ1(34) S-adenosylmethionine ribosyltransferase-isomerase QueA [Chloroflexi bacterium]|nr:tRNA preQ1(34) S-adenosylmethionine ribosyltransferase-isomerase QueA [Chloroflexota bacterium]